MKPEKLEVKANFLNKSTQWTINYDVDNIKNDACLQPIFQALKL